MLETGKVAVHGPAQWILGRIEEIERLYLGIG